MRRIFFPDAENKSKVCQRRICTSLFQKPPSTLLQVHSRNWDIFKTTSCKWFSDATGRIMKERGEFIVENRQIRRNLSGVWLPRGSSLYIKNHLELWFYPWLVGIRHSRASVTHSHIKEDQCLNWRLHNLYYFKSHILPAILDSDYRIVRVFLIDKGHFNLACIRPRSFKEA